MTRTRGFSLVELMVATVIGAVITAAAFTALARARSSWATSEIENRLHERAQYVFATLESDLQMSGYFAGAAPLAVPADQIAGGAAGCGVDVVARLDQAVESRETFALACAAQGGGHVADTDVLLLRRASAHLATPGSGRLQWLSCPTPACTSALLADPVRIAAVQPAAAERRDLIVRIYYVARAADGDSATPALRVKSLTAISGAPAFVDTEVMPGVDDLQVTLEPDASQPGSVQVTVGVRPDASDRSGGPMRRLSLTRHFALRNAPRAG